MSDLERLQAENAKLKRQLDKAIDGLDCSCNVCPRTLELKDYYGHCRTEEVSCRDCWQKALEEVE